MKTAKLEAMLISVICPHCEESVVCPDSSSYDWTAHDFTGLTAITCENCNKRFALPKTIKL